MAFLVQIILPLYRNDGRRLPPELLKQVRRELKERFGGLTAYTRTPAEGTWEDDQGQTKREDVVIVEVMSYALDRQWWSNYAAELARRFEQDIAGWPCWWANVGRCNTAGWLRRQKRMTGPTCAEQWNCL